VDLSVVHKYFPSLSQTQVRQLSDLLPVYREWNARINVISRKDMDDFYLHHVVHSLSIARFVQFGEDARILDAGTGGGFPGIPLAILFPTARFHLVDSIGKKIRVVEAVVQAIGLQNVTAEQARLEAIGGTYDFVVSRAVTSVRELHQWLHRRLAVQHRHPVANGFLLLKGGDLTEELRDAGRKAEVIEISRYFDEPYFETKKIVYIPV
jgi:16S rRNA (guanine527-N7)-methyltransferase